MKAHLAGSVLRPSRRLRGKLIAQVMCRAGDCLPISVCVQVLVQQPLQLTNLRKRRYPLLRHGAKAGSS
jgi:hypothetical protein